MEPCASGSLNEEEIRRYSRHILLQEVGGRGQEKLMRASVLIVGAGGLGSPAALYLAAAGIGTIGIADSDRVSLENLHRQIIHFTTDIEKPKVESASEKITALNPGVRVITHHCYLDTENAREIIAPYDVIVEATDRLSAKFLMNEVCVRAQKSLAHAAAIQFAGQATTVVPGSGPCLRCMFPDISPETILPTCADFGIIGPLPGILGTIQAVEALKLILGIGNPLIGRLLTIDTLGMDVSIIPFERNPDCPVCGKL